MTARLLATGGAAVAAVGALSAFLFLPENEFTSGRGHFIVNPLEGIGRVATVWLPQLQDLAASGTRFSIHTVAFDLGIDDLRRPVVLIVFGATVVVGTLAVGGILRHRQRPEHAPVGRSALLLGATGLALFAVAAVFPAAFLTEQSPVTRLLFASWVGLALAGGCLVSALGSGWTAPPRRTGGCWRLGGGARALGHPERLRRAVPPPGCARRPADRCWAAGCGMPTPFPATSVRSRSSAGTSCSTSRA